MILAEADQTALIIGCCVAGVAVVFVGAAVLWQQGKDIGRLREDLDDAYALIDDARRWALGVHAHLFGELPDPAPPDPGGGEERDTVISHPADTWARKQALLARYQHTGQHRS